MESIIEIYSKDDIRIGVVLNAPKTHELLVKHVDLVVVCDHVGLTPFSMLLDSCCGSTEGFLNKKVLDEICESHGNKAQDPRRLLHLRGVSDRKEDVSNYETLSRQCSIERLEDYDSQYRGKYVLFVPSLTRRWPPLPDSYAIDYVEASLAVAGALDCSSIYFAGMAELDGSFPDDWIAEAVARIGSTRDKWFPHPRPLRCLFKYWPMADQDSISRLASRLGQEQQT